MPGTLDRLFNFAKGAKARTIENFTTEVLAAAIRAEHDPFTRALADLGLPRVDKLERAPIVETQVHVPGGIVDLVTEFSDGKGNYAFWTEVKAHAGESGTQMANYAEAARLCQDPPTVLMICKRPICRVTTLRWNDLRMQISLTSDRYWLDLREFLEDNQMADDFDKPITLGEIAIASTAHSLLRKIARLSHEFLTSLPPGAWKGGNFPETESKAIASIAQQFRRRRRLVVKSRRYPTVYFGVVPHEPASLRVWIELQTTDFAAREGLFAVARNGGLEASWDFQFSRRPQISQSRVLDGELDQEKAITWLTQRFLELETAGVFKALPRWRRKGREDLDEDE